MFSYWPSLTPENTTLHHGFHHETHAMFNSVASVYPECGFVQPLELLGLFVSCLFLENSSLFNINCSAITAAYQKVLLDATIGLKTSCHRLQCELESLQKPFPTFDLK